MDYSKLEKGMEGEKIVSKALTELNIPHQHHDFSSIPAYSCSMNHGSDLWEGIIFQIEVKNWPNSWLTQYEYEKEVKPRFDSSTKIKICVVIGGRMREDFLRCAEADNVKVVCIEEINFFLDLKTRLRYYFTVGGYWDRFVFKSLVPRPSTPQAHLVGPPMQIASNLVENISFFHYSRGKGPPAHPYFRSLMPIGLVLARLRKNSPDKNASIGREDEHGVNAIICMLSFSKNRKITEFGGGIKLKTCPCLSDEVMMREGNQIISPF